MSLLDEVAGTQPVNLDELVEATPLPPLRAPEAAIKNRAAMTALLSGNPEGLVEDYQAMVAEAQEGTDYTRQSIKKRATDQARAMDMDSVIKLLADPSVSLEQKQFAIAQVNKEQETAELVATHAAMASSKGENVEQEDVRILGAEQFREVHESRQRLQALKNKHAAGLSLDSTGFVADFLEILSPLSTNVHSGKVLKKIAEELKLGTTTLSAAILPGSTTVAIRDALANIPPSQRIEVQERIMNIIEANNGIIFTSDNDFQEYITAQAIFEEGGYDNIDKWLDNMVGLLDIVGLGFAVKGADRALRLGRDALNESRAVSRRAITDSTSPVAPLPIMSDANPEKARNMYELIVRSETDEVAQALAGTSRDEALAAQHLPQPSVPDGSVLARLPDPDRNLRVIQPDEDVVEAAYDNGGIYMTSREKMAARAHVLNDMQNVSGLVPHDNMVSVGVDGNRIVVDAVYGGTEGGFLSGADALAQARFALREYGVVDRDLMLVKRDGAEYVPVTEAETVGVPGDYLVRTRFSHEINPSDIGGLDPFDVKNNLFDRTTVLRSKNSGTLARVILDAASMLDPRLTGGAAVVADRAVRVDKALLNLHDKFATAYQGLAKDRQSKLYEHIKEANYKELELSDVDLRAQGFNTEEISILKDWRKAWDTHFWLENADLARNLQVQGFKLLETANARLFAKEIPKNQNIAKAYDAATDSIVSLSKQELDDLYDNGGTLARLRRAEDLGGEVVEHVVVRNTPTEHLRGIRSFDQVLNYKKGYYQVHYKAPKFVEQIVRDSKGVELYRRTLATADSTAEAEHTARRLAATKGVSVDDFNIRGDINELRPDTDAYWDIQSASGRIAQRHRGKRLEDASGPVTVSNTNHIADPIESGVRAARSLSGRVASRDFLEISKHRATQQYGHLFDPSQKKADQTPLWPSDSNSLMNPGNQTSKEIADARTTVEYLNYLQYGYINSVDNFFKAGMNFIGEMLHKAGMSKAEKAALMAANVNPANIAKTTVFQALIATNPLRQALLQAHQMIRILGYNPQYLVSGGLTRDALKYGEAILSGTSKFSKEDKELVDFVKKSGMLDAVDRHNLVRGALTDMVETASRSGKVIGKALSVPRRLGFDAGEQANIMSHLLAVRDRYRRAGKDLNDKAVRDQAYAEARAISYDMNFAGDLPYNQNWASVAMQFFQVPHKAITSVTFNRRLTPQQKLQMALADVLIWGVPGGTMIANLIGEDALPEDPTVREGVLFGLESVIMNRVFSSLAGREVNIDFSSLSPYGIEGWANLFTGMLSGGIAEIMNNSPSATIFWKEGSRMREAIGRLARYTGVLDPYEGHSPEDITSVLMGVLEISSGWSNAMKAQLILNTGKLQNKQGVVLSQDAGWLEATAKMFGFSTQDEVLLYAASKELSAGKKTHREDVERVVKSYMGVLARTEKLNNMDDEYVIKVLGAIKTLFKDDPVGMEIAHNYLQKNMTSLKDSVIRRGLDYANIKGASDTMNNFRNLKLLKDEDLEKAQRLMDDAQRNFEEE